MFFLLHNLGGNNPESIPRLFRNKTTGKYYTVVRNIYWLNRQLFVNIPVVLEYSYQSKDLNEVSDTDLFKELLTKVNVDIKLSSSYYIRYDTENPTKITEKLIESLNWNSNVIEIDYTGDNLLNDLLREFKVVSYDDILSNPERYQLVPLIVFFALFEPFGIIYNKDYFKREQIYLLLYYYKGIFSWYHTDNLIMNSDSTINCQRVLPFALLDITCIPDLSVELGTLMDMKFVFPESETLILEFLANDNVELSRIVSLYKAYLQSAQYVKIEVSDNTGYTVDDLVGRNIYPVLNELDTLEKSENSFRKSWFRLLYIPEKWIKSTITLEHLENLGSYLIHFFDWYLLSNFWTFRLNANEENLIVPANYQEVLTLNYWNVSDKEQYSSLFEANEILVDESQIYKADSKLLFRLQNEPVDITETSFDIYTSFDNSYINLRIPFSVDTTADFTNFEKTLKYILFEKPDVEVITNLGEAYTNEYQVNIENDYDIVLSFVLPDSLANQIDDMNSKLDRYVKAGLLFKPLLIKEVKIKL